MMPIFRKRKNDLAIKDEILKGVYEDNLRIVGKGHQVLSRQKPFIFNKFLLTLLLRLPLVLIPRYPSSLFQHTPQGLADRRMRDHAQTHHFIQYPECAMH